MFVLAGLLSVLAAPVPPNPDQFSTTKPTKVFTNPTMVPIIHKPRTAGVTKPWFTVTKPWFTKDKPNQFDAIQDVFDIPTTTPKPVLELDDFLGVVS